MKNPRYGKNFVKIEKDGSKNPAKINTFDPCRGIIKKITALKDDECWEFELEQLNPRETLYFACPMSDMIEVPDAAIFLGSEVIFWPDSLEILFESKPKHLEKKRRKSLEIEASLVAPTHKTVCGIVDTIISAGNFTLITLVEGDTTHQLLLKGRRKNLEKAGIMINKRIFTDHKKTIISE
jgi:hypothetical protein